MQRALHLAGAVGQPLTEARALFGLSELALTSGDPGQAVVFGQRASEVFHSMGALLDDMRALTLLSEAYAALGDTDAATAASAEVAVLSGKLMADASRRPPEADVRRHPAESAPSCQSGHGLH